MMRCITVQKPRHVSISTWVISVCGLILLPSLVMAQDANPPAAPDAAGDPNRLIYVVDNYGESDNTTFLYDADTGTQTPITEVNIGTTFSFGSDGRLAFAAFDNDDIEVLVWDVTVPEAAPIKVSRHPDATDIPLEWSPDGRYLAFASTQERMGMTLYLWDGATVIDITPDSTATISGVDVAWGAHDQLAFTAWFAGSAGAYSGEVYLWNGEQAISVSQNPTGEDSSPAWSPDGRLAFLSARNGEYDIFVWDGVSMKNGLPDRDTFINVAPELTGYYSEPTWTNDGRLAFTGAIRNISRCKFSCGMGKRSPILAKTRMDTVGLGAGTLTDSGRLVIRVRDL